MCGAAQEAGRQADEPLGLLREEEVEALLPRLGEEAHERAGDLLVPRLNQYNP